MNGDIEGAAMDSDVAIVGLFEAFAEGGVVCFPDEAADGEGGEIQVLRPEGEFDFAGFSGDGIDAVDAASLFVLIGVAFIEDDAVAFTDDSGETLCVEGDFGGEFDDDAAGCFFDDRAEFDAAAFGEESGDEGLMIQTAEEAMGEAA